MKKLVLALTAMAALTAPALAADMAPRYAKAPVAVAPAVSWTGCWISGGGGYGISRTNRDSRDVLAPNGINVLNATSGSDGWLATAGVGCDYQFSGRWVVGAFVDGTYSDIKGDHAWRVFGPAETFVGENKMDWSWAVGGRIGYLVNPSFLTYFNAGYTQAHTDAYNLQRIVAPFSASGLTVPGQTFDGFFIGSGFEYQLDFLPGLFVKTEGRAAWYDRKDSRLSCTAVVAGTACTAAALGTDPHGNIDSRKMVTYIAKTELVYRFNWGGPVVAKY
ncbi:autotransporter domain-containing protein [Bradyrhizobium sp. JYMT SZCCT0180]|uniref:outer membrane protein n=1 Tax=Bradyrhizobium sp. JYMT SZCCT0180 TaxID=2807666 RepID=UPI001BA801FC|nr:autotransporter domain-containing protein [Bradyrhizobium sp. JYMT SZCCT0180]MBR1210148.1 autotransporter domain-containing protein [Bradyrhizobium sp. JYMT SZCCT0180]